MRVFSLTEELVVEYKVGEVLRLVGGDHIGRDVGLGAVLPSLLLGHVEALGEKKENLNISFLYVKAKVFRTS